ncbi:hypothetical protein CAPTEDRAFT_216835 [Capitella teleta]|uniref:LRRCT domain-containing protein n=1 Tax=Capitella teleta TaxID=283909 RepID=R7URL5_CAPTE|nr:hypothetical protein CAPTEDRAFT_216835 [Capitella teleta]|eukprot:ELU09149.1 hypothetical protein CAPTEDRAFT_216835 [Capitella teleta]
MNLTEVPQPVIPPSNATVLNLGHNIITNLPSLTFVGYPDLDILTVVFNSIQYIDSSAFNGTRLRVLKAWNNRLTEIPDFSTIENFIEIIDLHKNKIDSMAVDFSRLKQLKKLHLGSNQIQIVSLATLLPHKHLSQLILRNNRISSVTNPGVFSARTIAISLTQNDLNCDCRLAWTTAGNCGNMTVEGECSTPLHLSGTQLANVDFTQICSDTVEFVIPLLSKKHCSFIAGGLFETFDVCFHASAWNRSKGASK